jgi:hypothetical protein
MLKNLLLLARNLGLVVATLAKMEFGIRAKTSEILASLQEHI